MSAFHHCKYKKFYGWDLYTYTAQGGVGRVVLPYIEKWLIVVLFRGKKLA